MGEDRRAEMGRFLGPLDYIAGRGRPSQRAAEVADALADFSSITQRLAA
jgi:hypothetical protein